MQYVSSLLDHRQIDTLKKEYAFKNIALYKKTRDWLQKKQLPRFEGFSFYDLIKMYLSGLIKGDLTSRAGSISFSFFMAIFPALLFVLNLIPYIPIENFTVFSGRLFAFMA